MIILLGVAVVVLSVSLGYVWTGGNLSNLMHASELLIIGGAAVGATLIMAPQKVLKDLFRQSLQAMGGAPFKRQAYEELFQLLYELFLLGRRHGLVALEDHLSTPASSAIFQRYPQVIRNQNGVQFLCGALKPVIDGRVKPDQLRQLLETDLTRMEDEGHAPILVLNRTSDALPGFGIVAAVLGIVNTMAAIAGPIETIGVKVAAALVGTFLGIFMAYGFVAPFAGNLEFNMAARTAYFRCISTAVVGFASGMAPGMAVELSRRTLSDELRPTESELEETLRALNTKVAPAR